MQLHHMNLPQQQKTKQSQQSQEQQQQQQQQQQQELIQQLQLMQRQYFIHQGFVKPLHLQMDFQQQHQQQQQQQTIMLHNQTATTELTTPTNLTTTTTTTTTGTNMKKLTPRQEGGEGELKREFLAFNEDEDLYEMKKVYKNQQFKHKKISHHDASKQSDQEDEDQDDDQDDDRENSPERKENATKQEHELSLRDYEDNSMKLNTDYSHDEEEEDINNHLARRPLSSMSQHQQQKHISSILCESEMEQRWPTAQIPRKHFHHHSQYFPNDMMNNFTRLFDTSASTPTPNLALLTPPELLDNNNDDSNKSKLYYHPLYSHGICRWPGCEIHIDNMSVFVK